MHIYQQQIDTKLAEFKREADVRHALTAHAHLCPAIAPPHARLLPLARAAEVGHPEVLPGGAAEGWGSCCRGAAELLSAHWGVCGVARVRCL